MANSFLRDYGHRIENLNLTLNECVARGSADMNLDLDETLTLYRGMIAEIKNLQLQVDSLKEALIGKAKQ